MCSTNRYLTYTVKDISNFSKKVRAYLSHMYKHDMVETIGLYVSVYIQTAKWTQRDQFAV